MLKVFKIVGAVIGVLLVVSVGTFLWLSSSAEAKLAQKPVVHESNFPIPMPLSEEEIAELSRDGERPSDEELAKIALDRAIERGKHLLTARYACADCHGADYGGGTMVDDPAMGSLLGPNLTSGKGSVTKDYTAADWDRIVRHGIRKDGRPALMPSEDFLAMSDRELGDIVAYIGAQPPVDKDVPESTLGPVGKILVATGRFRLAYETVDDHAKAHSTEPPRAEESVEFGKHLAQVCTGCHRKDLAGGPIVQGPPDWPAAANLTPHEQGLGSWTFEEFEAAMRKGLRRDGSEMGVPMSAMTPYGQRMTETEMKALWLYLRSLPPTPMGT